MLNYKFNTAIVIFLISFQLNCKNEYANSSGLCVIALAQLQQNLAKDLQDLNEGRITQAVYDEKIRLRENGTTTICLTSFVKREQNGNF
ncbi:hypothetical protein EHQ68_04605 [Leptospira congkakensis]|uniref:TIGR04452 family lipoprotein n=1 Tax=Leptospira congkakensis TaxID=2484932 RepID=A0A4Z1A6T6_9LEPT|nr:hypothetical protein [Leptospira congkakensis]TGL90709.1 hypothetical protein EHQ69_12365 [Leptospira congkakensis]TGL91716.1 hypothetical protein EHQ68_04605 [Leptospira congkakensis]TGL98769.1 hypothetical protein EHQ70_04190 [Leptospira congkakensis]